MEAVTQMTEYKVGSYRVQIEKDFQKGTAQVWMFDEDNHIVFSADGVKEAREKCVVILQVLDSLNLK